MPNSKIMVQWTGEGTAFRILNGTHLGEIVDSDDIQWNCPKCGAKWNDAGDDCIKCGEDSPYEIVPPVGGTLRQPTKPNYGRDVKQIMHQMKKSPGAPKLSSVLDSIADCLEAKGLIKEAYEIDKAADILEKTTQKK